MIIAKITANGGRFWVSVVESINGDEQVLWAKGYDTKANAERGAAKKIASWG